MKNWFIANRTLWHSGLLFLLFILVMRPGAVGAKVLVGVADSEGVNVRPNGHHFVIADLDRVEVVCQRQDPEPEVGGVLKLVLNGNQILSKNVISGQAAAVQLDQENFGQPVNKLECFVSYEDLFRTSSYAFAYFVREAVATEAAAAVVSLDVVEGELSVPAGGRVSLRCKLEAEGVEDAPFPGFKWLKNAEQLDLATSENFDDKKISEWEQHLVVDKVSAADAGNYGCLISGSVSTDGQLYEETSLSVTFPPVVVARDADDVVSVRATEDVVLSCKISSANPPVENFSW